MVSTLYFMLFFVVLLLLCFYLVKFGTGVVLHNDNSFQQGTFHFLNNGNKFMDTLNSKYELKEETSEIKQPTQFNAIDINFEIKRQSRQLKRNLKTLNYISQLEANTDLVDNPKRLEEIVNLRKGVQRQIIKNTNLLNKYRLTESKTQ